MVLFRIAAKGLFSLLRLFYLGGSMEEYKLEIKQIIDYPRCRMHRQFVRGLIEDTNIRVGGESGLYYYTVLSCFANFRTSHHRIKGVTYTLYPGEWICKVEELMRWFRVRNKRQTISIMEKLQEKHLLKFKIVGQGDVIKYRLSGWAKYNRILEYNAFFNLKTKTFCSFYKNLRIRFCTGYFCSVDNGIKGIQQAQSF